MTTDVFMQQDQAKTFWDIPIDENGDFQNGDFFDTSILYSLLGERRALSSEVSISENRRGWIGNENSDFENGSKLWLYEQARLTRTTLSGTQSTSLGALQWFIDDGLLVNVEASAVAQNNSIILQVTLFRFNSRVERRFFVLWENTGVN